MSARARHRRARGGFTMIEIMMVIVIFGVFAALALVSVRGSRSAGEVSSFSRVIANRIMMARRRALATGVTYLVDVRANSVAYCEIPTGTKYVTCPPPTGPVCGINATVQARPCEYSGIAQGGNNARVMFYSLEGQPSQAMPLFVSVYLRPDGTVSTGPSNIPNQPTPMATGFNFFLGDIVHPNDGSQHRVVSVSPVAAKPRVTDHDFNW